MRSVERYLITLESWPWSAVSRVALGLIIPPIFRVLSGESDSIWIYFALFIGLLAVLRVVPALVRHAVPFSAEATTIWAQRRYIAKQYDSYQWQKLFWIGLGLLPHAVIGGGMGKGELVITFICLAGGSAGLLLWQRVDAAPSAN